MNKPKTDRRLAAVPGICTAGSVLRADDQVHWRFWGRRDGFAETYILAWSKPTFNGAWVFTDDHKRKAWVTQKHIFLPHVFLPRVGLAVRVNDKTAVSIGFARYVVPVVAGNNHNLGSANTKNACVTTRRCRRNTLPNF